MAEGKIKTTEKAIRESLEKQLRDKGAQVSHFQGLINDYIFYLKCERKMQKDIRQNGIKYMRLSAKGYEIESENPAVKSAVMYNKQMLQILKEMGLSTDKCLGDGDNEL